MITYWRRSGALGLASIKVISDSTEQAQEYAAKNNLEFMVTYSARSLDTVMDLRVNQTKMLMNPATGSVDTEENWLAEMPTWETTKDGKTPQEQFDSLVEVIKDENGEWREKQ